jgi:phosphomethylpyrimidine synthase
VRDYAATLNDPAGVGLGGNENATLYPDAAEKGLAEMSEKFRQMGKEVYVDAKKVKESNKGL